MSGKIVIVNLEDVPGDRMADGAALVRNLISRSHGSNRMEVHHDLIDEGYERKGITTDDTGNTEDEVSSLAAEGYDEIFYVIKGEVDVTFDGKTHHIGPRTACFIPAKTSFGFKVTKGPIESISIQSPPRH